MKYKDNWAETEERFKLWWEGKNSGRPLMRVVGKRKSPTEPLEIIGEPKTPEEFYMDVENNIIRYRNYCKAHTFLGEAFPSFSVDLGPGSMALYLGAEPNFTWDTVWFKECIEDWDKYGDFVYNQDNYWWKKHIEIIKKAKELSDVEFIINIPDIIENIDIPLVMRGTENIIFDIMDEPDMIKKYLKQIDELYFKYYNQFYDIVKNEDGSSCYTVFSIWGPGKTAKIQCDFSAMMSPNQFREFILPSLKKQCKNLDYSLYHLDGPDAIKHVDAIMEIKELKALQWTCGAGKPDGGCVDWYPIYDKVRAAGKSLWIQLYDGDFKDWINSAEKLIKRYGTEGLYLIFPDMEEDEAIQLMDKAEKEWK
jgi:hypothetical protein